MHHLFTGIGGTRVIKKNSIFPLALHGGNRYLIDANATPFFLHGDTPWSLIVQFTYAQIDTYLANRAAKGINTILFNAIEHQYSDQSPAYRTVEGYDPFSPMTDFASPNETYWQKVDYVVNQCLNYGIVCLINPAYLGYLGGSEGWMSEVTAETAGDLQTFGAWLANRYTQKNIVWCFGGDFAGDTTQRNKQWNIVTGMRSVRTTDIITCHNGRSDSDAYTHWNGYSGFNLNNTYTTKTDVYTECATAFGRTMPFFFIEGAYEGSATVPELRVQHWQAILSGACGHYYGENPLWAGGAANAGGSGAANAISNHLNTTGIQHLGNLLSFSRDFPWYTLEPKTDASLVSSALGSGQARVCPARSADGTFAAILKNDASSITVVMSAMSPSSVRARWYDPSNGTLSAVSGSPFANTGSQTIAHPGNNSAGSTDWVLILNAADTVNPSIGLHAIDYDIQGEGTSPMTATLGATQSSGSTIVACSATYLSDTGAPTDNKGNTYSLLEAEGYYGGQWPGYGPEIYACANAVGGAGHALSVAKPGYPTDESTIIAVEVKNGGVIQDSSIVARQSAGASANLVSASVTTTGPAVLVSFWNGDGAPVVPLAAQPEAGWTEVREVALDGVFHIQMACAVKEVTAAGTYTCTWTPSGNQGGVIAMVAVQKA
jgi:hypothetical protein